MNLFKYIAGKDFFDFCLTHSFGGSGVGSQEKACLPKRRGEGRVVRKNQTRDIHCCTRPPTL